MDLSTFMNWSYAGCNVGCTSSLRKQPGVTLNTIPINPSHLNTILDKWTEKRKSQEKETKTDFSLKGRVDYNQSQTQRERMTASSTGLLYCLTQRESGWTVTAKHKIQYQTENWSCALCTPAHISSKRTYTLVKEKLWLYKNIWRFVKWTSSAGFRKPDEWQWDSVSLAHSSGYNSSMVNPSDSWHFLKHIHQVYACKKKKEELLVKVKDEKSW